MYNFFHFRTMRKFFWVSSLVVCVLSITIFGPARQSIHATSSTTTSTKKHWSIVSSPNPSTDGDIFNGLAAITTNNFWAVGDYTNQGSGYTSTLIEHWDGASWSVISSPNPKPVNDILNSVVAISATNIWAVGYYDINTSSSRQGLIEHWTGKKWNVISTSFPSNYELMSVTAVSAKDVWTVGASLPTTAPSQPLSLHWDGTSWNVISSPDLPIGGIFVGVTTVYNNIVWAVGEQYTNVGYTQTLIERWNSSGWKVISSPIPSQTDS